MRPRREARRGGGSPGRWLLVAFVAWLILPRLLQSPVAAFVVSVLVMGGVAWFVLRHHVTLRGEPDGSGQGGPRPSGWLLPGDPAPLPGTRPVPAAGPRDPHEPGGLETHEPEDDRPLAELEARLEELARLRDAGVISGDEYERRRARAIADF